MTRTRKPPKFERKTPEEWFAGKGWQPFAFQKEAWTAYRNGENGLIHSNTGTGKTYAAYFGSLLEGLDEPQSSMPPPVRVLWITPLRALSRDTALTLEAPLHSLGFNWDVGTRTGDTSTSARAKQKKRLPTVLVTTPESLSLLLTYPEAREQFANLRSIVVDEWHELLGTKRGVLTELALARLRRFQPAARTWGLSATIGNLETARAVLLGSTIHGRIICGRDPKPMVIDALLPPQIERFPWAGHLGLSMIEPVVNAINEGCSALVFTNTRSQTETWYQAILAAKPEWAGQMALHHGSLDRKRREWVEDQLRAGTLRCVVCTSTLDLGVDFAPVDRVLQIGSLKSVARLLQRAGRSGHQPGATSRVTCVPASVLELMEVAAARSAAEAGKIEGRDPIIKPLDLLAQHAVSSALAGGFRSDELLAEIRTTHSYQHLTADEWEWILDFITRGGEALWAYPDFRRVTIEGDLYVVNDARLARRHRQSVGTITAEASVEVRFLRGGRLGTVEETFAARLKRGDIFTFAGRNLEFIRMHEISMQVRLNRKPATTIPRWAGGRLPISTELAAAVRRQLDDARNGRFASVEMKSLRPILDIQSRRSGIPRADQLLVERLIARDGYHLFVYPFEGRLVHEGLAALAAYRLTRVRPQTFTLAVNDYGFSLASPDPFIHDVAELKSVLHSENLSADVLNSLNAAELAKRQFRDVARVAGLVNPGLPYARKSTKQIQASSGLFYEVFREYDPANRLLEQARREVLDRQFEGARLLQTLNRIQVSEILLVEIPKPTPFAFPLHVERMREGVSSEKLSDRVRRMATALERGADKE